MRELHSGASLENARTHAGLQRFEIAVHIHRGIAHDLVNERQFLVSLLQIIFIVNNYSL